MTAPAPLDAAVREAENALAIEANCITPRCPECFPRSDKRLEEAEAALRAQDAWELADAALRLALATANRERDEYAQSRVAVWEEKYAALLAERDAAVARLNEANEREEKLHETNERLALDIVGAEEDRDDLAEILAAALDEIEVLNEVYHEDNAVCLCGCPLSEHEDNGEDGEQCDHEGHVCLRTCPAIRDLYQTALAQKGAPDV